MVWCLLIFLRVKGIEYSGFHRLGFSGPLVSIDQLILTKSFGVIWLACSLPLKQVADIKLVWQVAGSKGAETGASMCSV